MSSKNKTKDLINYKEAVERLNFFAKNSGLTLKEVEEPVKILGIMFRCIGRFVRGERGFLVKYFKEIEDHFKAKEEK